jgi:hypothetical protein
MLKKIRFLSFKFRQKNRWEIGKIFFWNRLTGYKKLAFYTGVVATLIVLTPLVVEMMKNAGKIDAAWFDDNWAYRKSLVFTHNAAVSNTKVKFDIDTTTAPEKFQADCGDVRFTDGNGNLLKYYYDSSGGARLLCIDTFHY